VYDALREANISVPRQMSVMGFNDTQGEMLYPQLTTVREFPEELGRHLAEFALQRGDGELAAIAYADLARRTRDPKILERTVEVAGYVRRLDLALDAARLWASSFVHWYNFDHRHSGIRYVSPAQRHAGEDRAILAARHALYAEARQRNPNRWSRHTRNWEPIGVVTLNPERDSVVDMTSRATDRQPLAA
jgi:hypothetical protein